MLEFTSSDSDDETFAQIMAQGNYDEPSVNKDVSQTGAVVGVKVQNPLYGVALEAHSEDASWSKGGFSTKQQSKLRQSRPLASYDYHGDTVKKAYERLGEHLSRSLEAGHDVIELIHGKGTGKLSGAMRGWIRDCSYVVAYAEPRDNRGSVLVMLKVNLRA